MGKIVRVKKFDRIVPSPLPFHYYLASHDIMIMRGTDVLTAAVELLFNEKHRMIIAARKLELTMPRKKSSRVRRVEVEDICM